jgi:hypothetical protein
VHGLIKDMKRKKEGRKEGEKTEKKREKERKESPVWPSLL